MRTLGQVLGTSGKSVHEDDVDLRPGESRDYLVDGHHQRVTATDQLGRHSGRRRYRVECLTCGAVVHEATTGAHANMRTHARFAAEDAALAFTRAVQALISGAKKED